MPSPSSSPPQSPQAGASAGSPATAVASVSERRTEPLRAVKGMNDILPGESERFAHLEDTFRRVLRSYGYREVRTPLVEPTALFVRAIGEATDVVEKEMYSFAHRGEELTLRPEGTAGAARAYVEHRVHNGEPVSRWFYLGAMFRAERPQRGRYRQFHQAGGEVFGEKGPVADAEMIALLCRLLDALGIRGVDVVVNSLGGPEARLHYREALRVFLEPKRRALSEESQRRLDTNPLRILDSKDPRDHAAVEAAPTLLDSLSDEDRAHFDGLRRLLDALAVPYRVDPRLVRGLDYYTRTLFEIKAAPDKLGAGSTVVGGGRYDRMVAELGGAEVPAIGFAAGIERLLIAAGDFPVVRTADVVVAPMGETATGYALRAAEALRSAGLRCDVDGRGASLKSMLRRADGLGALLAVLVGDQEVRDGTVVCKNLKEHTQQTVPFAALVDVARTASKQDGAAGGPREAP